MRPPAAPAIDHEFSAAHPREAGFLAAPAAPMESIMEPASTVFSFNTFSTAACKPRASWPGRVWHAIAATAREAVLYAAGSGASRLRQYEAVREMDPRMLRDMGLDVDDVMRDCLKSSKNVPPGA